MPTPDEMVDALNGGPRRLPVPVHTVPIRRQPSPVDDPSFAALAAMFQQPPFSRGLPWQQMRPSTNVEPAIPEADYSRPLGVMSHEELDAHMANRAEENRRLREAMDAHANPPAWSGLPLPGMLAGQAGFNDVGRVRIGGR
jgi:hypothetical protein